MRGLLAIYRREMAGLFFGPLAWVLLALVFLLNGYLFVLYLKSSGGNVDTAVRLSLGDSWAFWVLLILVPPLLTMRMVSEESKSGLLEFLLTAPISDASVIVGKFLAATTFLALMWSAVFVYAGALSTLGAAPDTGVLIGGWIGAVLASALFSAVGLLASALTNTPVLAAFGAVLMNLVIVIAPLLSNLSDDPVFQRAIRHIDVIDHHTNSFLLGLFDTSYAVFFVAWTVLFLFLTVRALETRRWA
ncbi:MAG: ABC transporter permease subunit [Planctomycetota bacterium]|nr:ABC transporter permease subunit [Planctomycetota bacterium]